MKIYLLILAIAILSHSKFRHLNNLTINTPSPPLIKSLTPTEIAYQYDSTLVTFNLTNQVKLQTINLPPGQTVDLLSSQSVLLYVNQDTIYQSHSNVGKYDYKFTTSEQNWFAQTSSLGNTFIAPSYRETSSYANFKIFGPNPWNVKTIQWHGVGEENIRGGSGVSLVSQDQFYFVAGGVCNDGQGHIYLQKGNKDNIQNIHQVPIINCQFNDQGYNKDWLLSTYKLKQRNYHLLTYASNTNTPKRFTTQIISQQNNNIEQIAHFDIDRLIGINLIDENTIFTVDNLFCRVLEHDIQHHEHQHSKTEFEHKPVKIFVSPSEKYIISIALFQSSTNNYAIIHQIDDNKQFVSMRQYFVSAKTNVVRAQTYADQFIVLSDDSNTNPLSIKNLVEDSSINTNIVNIVDFCVSDVNIIYVLSKSSEKLILGAYNIEGKTFQTLNEIDLATNFKSITCMNDNNVFLDSQSETLPLNIWQYNVQTKSLILIKTTPRNPTLHTKFTHSKNTLIFTNDQQNKATFYDFNFVQLKTLSFNLPPNSVYKIVRSKDNNLLLAIGDQIGKYSSLQHYTIDNQVIQYKGTFPYLDDGEADLSKTVLLPAKNAIRIQYQLGSTQWSTYFDLDAPPLKAYGYFMDENDKDCSLYDDAIIKTTSVPKELIVLNKNNNDYAILERYEINDNLKKVQSYPLNKYKVTNVNIKLSSNKKEIIVIGVDNNRRYNIQIRNLNLLSTIVYAKNELSSLDGTNLQTVEIFNGLITSVYSTAQDDQQDVDILFQPNTQNPVAIDNKLFSKINLFTTCPDCSKIAYNGPRNVVTDSPIIVVQDYLDPKSAKEVIINCLPNIIALSTGGLYVAWSCTNNAQINVKIVGDDKAPIILVPTIAFKQISELAFLDNNHLAATLDNVFKYLTINGKSEMKSINVGLTTTYAIDYSRGITAIAIDPSNIQINDLNNNIIETIPINNIDPISSLSFNSNGDLLISNSKGIIITLTQLPCPSDKLLSAGFCVCKQLYQTVGDQCICNYVYEGDGNCVCDDGQFFNGNGGCDSCSAMCSTCNSDGAFDCQDFSVWFFLIIIGSILIIAGAVLILLFRIKKNQHKQQTMYTQDRSKQSQPFVSDRQRSQEQVDISKK